MYIFLPVLHRLEMLLYPTQNTTNANLTSSYNKKLDDLCSI